MTTSVAVRWTSNYASEKLRDIGLSSEEIFMVHLVASLSVMGYSKYKTNKVNINGSDKKTPEIITDGSHLGNGKLNHLGEIEGISNPEKQILSGGEWDNYFKETYGAENVKWETKGNKYYNAIFANDEKLVSHYWKHRKEFGAYSLYDYLNQAREVMNNGYEVNYPYKGEIRTGFLEYYGASQKKGAKFAFVGTNSDGFITTFHTESGKTFWKMLNGQNIKVINPK